MPSIKHCCVFVQQEMIEQLHFYSFYMTYLLISGHDWRCVCVCGLKPAPQSISERPGPGPRRHQRALGCSNSSSFYSVQQGARTVQHCLPAVCFRRKGTLWGSTMEACVLSRARGSANVIVHERRFLAPPPEPPHMKAAHYTKLRRCLADRTKLRPLLVRA